MELPVVATRVNCVRSHDALKLWVLVIGNMWHHIIASPLPHAEGHAEQVN